MSIGSANRKDSDMQNSTQKSIQRLSIVTLVIGGLTLAYTYWEMIAQLWVDSYIYPLAWNPDIKGWQILYPRGPFRRNHVSIHPVLHFPASHQQGAARR